jgi:hypothetical protein
MVVDALKRQFKTVEVVSHPDWRITSAFASHIAEEAKRAIEVMRPSVVVIAGLEESYLMARYGHEVYHVPATKGPDGRHHIHGDFVVAPAMARLNCWPLLEQLLEATRGLVTLVISPMI